MKAKVSLKLLGIVLLLVGITFFTYRTALYNDFLTWDTAKYVVENEHIKALTWDNIRWMLTSFYVANWHPLTWFSHAVDYALFALNPWGHHLTSILFHCANTLLVFIVTVFILQIRQHPTHQEISLFQADNRVLLAASITAILFGIHPQHVESVAWIAERKDVLCLFFMLLATISYLVYATSRTRHWYLLTLLCSLLAILAKPMAVTLPVIFLILDVYPLQRTRLTGGDNTYIQLVLEKVPFFLLSLFSSTITILAQGDASAIADFAEVGLQIRILNAFNSTIFYISKWLFPIGLCPFYPFPPYRSLQEYYPSLIPVVGFILITVVCFYLWHRKHRYWLIIWTFYIVTLLPMVGLIQVGSQAAADRYAYLPTIPFYLLVGVATTHFFYLSWARLQKIIQAVIIIVMLTISSGLIYTTQRQILLWKDDITFWGYVVLFYPWSSLVQTNVGSAYYRSGYYQKAVEYYKNALEIDPASKVYINLILAYIKLERFDDALAMHAKALAGKIDIGQKPDVFYYNLGFLYFKLNRLEEAKQALQSALEKNPNYPEAKSLFIHVQELQAQQNQNPLP